MTITDITDNPLAHIDGSVFLKNTDLVMIRSDWYLVCRVAIDTDDCKPQNQFVSSCANLISSTAQRVIIMAQGIIVVVCNAAALVAQFAFIDITASEKYLIVSLIFADMLMGLYLLAIGTVDLMYNMTFYSIVSEWTNSVACTVFGLLNFISSELSLLILNILAFARMISIEKVGGMYFLKSQIRAACVCVWSVIPASGIAYVVYLSTNNIKIRNNMCILFGISHIGHMFDWESIIQIVCISVNMLLILAMIVSMSCMFYIILKSYCSVKRTSGRRLRSQELRLIHIGFKLLLLLACNVLTWLPFLTVSVLLLREIPAHENVLQWVVVLCIPICASTDPILYNLAHLKSQMKKK